MLPELCSPNVRTQIDCVQSVFLASPLSYLFQVTVLQLAVIIREVSVGLTLGIYYLISKTATLILIAPINSTHLYLKPRF